MCDDNITVSLITLPKPQVISEAYFIALIYCPWKLNFFLKQKVIPRFLLLEYSVPHGYGNQSTVLHEWTADGRHINLGYGCEPTLEAFYEAICNLLWLTESPPMPPTKPTSSLPHLDNPVSVTYTHSPRAKHLRITIKPTKTEILSVSSFVQIGQTFLQANKHAFFPVRHTHRQ